MDIECYSYDDAVRIISHYEHYIGHEVNNVPGRYGSPVSGVVQGFLVLPVIPETQDFEFPLFHYLNMVKDKSRWIVEKRDENYCWLALIIIGDAYLSIPSVMVALHDWNENWRS